MNALSKDELAEKLRDIRYDRYAIQSVARKALPSERVSKCLRMVQNQTQVEVWKHLKTEKSFYNGLMVCGSVWNCPICAAKISERRKLELQTAFELHKKEGGKLALLTLTFSHKKIDRLKEILKKFTSALAKFRSGKAYQKLRDKMGMIGSIRVFEVTYGLNGFHPHIHIAIFYTKEEYHLKFIEREMYLLWEKACNKFGLVTSEKHGLQLQNGDKVEEYLSKHGSWSLEQELSKSHIKVAKFESLSPFDFLREYLETDDRKYLTLFKEYAECFKGKIQIQWSKDLKKRFLIEDKKDEEVAKEKLEQADLLGLIPIEEWKYILKRDIRPNFLNWVEKYGFDIAYQILLNNKKKESSLGEDSNC